MSVNIDIDELLDRIQGDKELCLELFDIFTEDYPSKRDILLEAIETNNIEKIKEYAHGVKGATSNIALSAMKQTSLAIEDLACEGGSIEAMKAKITELDKQFEDFKVDAAKLKEQFTSES